jgi:ADP-ribose pyrophosphatase YjhB (NUDIX family)
MADGSSPRDEAIIWLWRHLPFSGPIKGAIAWLANVRYAVGVAAIIFDAGGRVLLVRHTYRGAVREWGLPGGWVKGRESLERALTRELREETGLEIVVEQLVTVQSGYSVPRMTVFYRARITGGTFHPSAEVSEYEYRSPSEMGRVLGGEKQAVEEALALGSARGDKSG